MGQQLIASGATYFFRWNAMACTVLALATLVGCGEKGISLVPAVGTVTLDGKPVDGASLLFMPTSHGPAASGQTDVVGRFTVQTANRAGVKVGEYKVAINKSETLVKQIPNSSMPLYENKYELPQHYASAETSGLTANVSSDSSANDFKFELKSK